VRETIRLTGDPAKLYSGLVARWRIPNPPYNDDYPTNRPKLVAR